MAHDTEKLRELLERCEASTKPDRILDAELDAALRFGTPRMQKWVWNNFPIWRASHSGMVEVVHDDGRGGVTWDSQPFTASLDASIALVERMLPGWKWCVGKNNDSDECLCYLGDKPGVDWVGEAPTVPLAILSALLRALISKAEGEDA